MNLIDFDGPKWGPTGKDVYERTYSRTKADGTKETWNETVRRVVDGNLSLVDSRFIEDGEREKLYDAIYNFRIIPAGRHLWMSGVEGRQFLFNCYVAGWGNSLSKHFTFTFNQLMEGGGVGSNYSAKYVNELKYPVNNLVKVELYCDPSHEDYEALMAENLLKNDAFEAWKIPDSRQGWARALEKVIGASTVDMSNGDYDHFLDKQTEIYRPVVRIDLSNIRAEGTPIKAFGGTSAGPVPLARLLRKTAYILNDAWELGGMSGLLAMELDHEIATCVVSGNVRRSARMSIMRWDDPWIDWFLNCKKKSGKHWSTNISVEIDDEFVSIIQGVDPEYAVTPRAQKAHKVYEAIIQGMLTNGEPGIWNSSLANEGEPNPVIATNPCGEICLEEWENCNLGHVNLDAFVFSDGKVDWDGLKEAHRLMTRFLIRATYGDISDPNTRAIVDRNRRIGVGHFGFAGFLAKRGIKFSKSWDIFFKNEIGETDHVRAELAGMKSWVSMTARKYSHQLRIPIPVKTTTVAPTGTIAKMPGRSEGVHPVYGRYFIRRIRYSMVDPDQARRVEEFRNQGYSIAKDFDTPNTWVVEIPTKEALVEELEDLGINPEILESVDEISLEDMLKVQAMYQEHYADNAVSFTVNIPPDTYSVNDVKKILLPYLSKLKGTTLMVDESRMLAPYERITKEEYDEMAGHSVDASYDDECASGACPVR